MSAARLIRRWAARVASASFSHPPCHAGARWTSTNPPRSTGNQWRRTLLASLLGLLAACLAIDAGYIHAKASLAQLLLARAWENSRATGEPQRPWPWADSHPVARLQMSRFAVDQVVLAGDSGRTIAFGPGWAEASASPGSRGTSVITAHRDTHFSWLRDVLPGDSIDVESANGLRRYRVISMQVADSRDDRLALDNATDQLILVTCWPFDAISSGGPLRYVVTAIPEIEPRSTEPIHPIVI